MYMCECMCVSVSYLRGGSDKITTVDDMKKLFRRNFIFPNISVSGENKISAGMNLFFFIVHIVFFLFRRLLEICISFLHLFLFCITVTCMPIQKTKFSWQ